MHIPKNTVKIRNAVIRKRTGVTDIAQRVGTLKWRWAGHIARRTDNWWSSSGGHAPEDEALDGLPLVGLTTLLRSRGADGCRRLVTVWSGVLWGRPISSSGCLPADDDDDDEHYLMLNTINDDFHFFLKFKVWFYMGWQLLFGPNTAIRTFMMFIL